MYRSRAARAFEGSALTSCLADHEGRELDRERPALVARLRQHVGDPAVGRVEVASRRCVRRRRQGLEQGEGRALGRQGLLELTRIHERIAEGNPRKGEVALQRPVVRFLDRQGEHRRDPLPVALDGPGELATRHQGLAVAHPQHPEAAPALGAPGREGVEDGERLPVVLERSGKVARDLRQLPERAVAAGELGLQAGARSQPRADREGLALAGQGALVVAEVGTTRRALHVADSLVGRGELALEPGVAAACLGQRVEVLEGILHHPLPDGGRAGKGGDPVVVVEQDRVRELANLVEARVRLDALALGEARLARGDDRRGDQGDEHQDGRRDAQRVPVRNRPAR